jgi:dipeptidyl aminopeptidase/acylaminoacyl peptidase
LATRTWKFRILEDRLEKFVEVFVTVAKARFRKPALQLLVVVAIAGSSLPFASPTGAQNLDKPVLNVDEEVTAFAYAPDGRIVFSVRRMFKNKKYDMQRDDIFVAETNGKRRRILEGQKFTHGDKPFTYQVESFTWSPNGHIVAVQLFTTTVDPEDEHHDDVRALLLLDDSGRELHPMGPDPLVPDAEAPMWLRDNGTLVYLTDEMARELFSMKYLYVAGGPPTKAFEGRTFIGAVRVPGSNSAIAIERDRNMEGPPRMQRLDLLSQDDKELATLDAYLGGLSVSPSGTKAAYFLDREVLEIRDLEKPERVVRMRVGLGVVQWNADETEIYVKRTVEKKSADLVTFRVPQLVAFRHGQVVPVTEPEPRQLLHGLAVREYALSADGRYLAIVLPGKRNLQVFGF